MKRVKGTPTEPDRSKVIATLGQLLVAEQALGRLLSLALPMKAAYHVAKLARLAGQELQHYREQYDALIKQFGVERPATAEEQKQFGGASVTAVTPENLEAFGTKLNELQAVSVEIAWKPIPLADLEGQKITGGDVNALGPLLDDSDLAAVTK